jgi:folate-dependent phosphoribosylglycinamide formyltransferase PurN
MIKNILNTKREIPHAAIFMSGSGSNAEKLLDSINKKRGGAWDASIIFTDAPLKSRASKIAEDYKIPYFELDILDFYKKRGETKVSLATGKGREIREEWTEEVRKILRPFNVDFGILAGFVPLTNITSDFPCLNVHPGDLTIEENGRRIFVGLHTVPIETAIVRNCLTLRSSVIIAQTYTGHGGEMDSGPILGISSPVKIDLGDAKLEEIKKIYESRPLQRPPGGYKDLLEDIARKNQENLKINGDWVVFPPAVKDFASGKFGYDENNFLYYMLHGNWKKIKTVEYSPFQINPIFI